MVIQVACESCGHTFGTKDEFAGKRGRCPQCNESLLVPLPGGATAPSEAPAPPVRSAAPVRPAAPTSHVEDLAEDVFSPVALGAGAMTAVVAAAVWAFVYYQFSYEHGLVAWAVGGAVGFAMVAAGGRGLPMALTAAVLSLAAIGGGKLAGMHLSLQREVQVVMDENFGREAYDEHTVDARDFAALGGGVSDDELAVYLEEHNYLPELLSEFREYYAPALLSFAADPPAFETWQEENTAMVFEGFSIIDAVIEELAAIDMLFAFFGLATAFKLLMRATGVPH